MKNYYFIVGISGRGGDEIEKCGYIKNLEGGMIRYVLRVCGYGNVNLKDWLIEKNDGVEEGLYDDIYVYVGEDREKVIIRWYDGFYKNIEEKF